ncbi:CidA-associated membrane protein CidB [Klebsiella michiganensis]|uniref:CidA-associated membrane protein CidB n=1 Tax=Klebsiella michiganensis TaxID=1134687 RepID=A0A7H4PDD8_9ENTR|nr:CidA-associated membrane protein CidB [Klebsiella michiganensis]
MSDFQLSLLCLLVTLGLYFANKRLYRRFHKLPLMPLVFTPILLVMMLVFGHISYQRYMGETHWLLWLLGPATIAFAVPVYDNMAIIKRHWMSADGWRHYRLGCRGDQFGVAGAIIYLA